MPLGDFINKDSAKRFATRAAQAGIEGGIVRSRLARYSGNGQGATYFSGRGYKGFREGTPPRTQSQQAVWGIPGPIGATRYSGFGVINPDRGIRGHSNQPYGVTPHESGSPSLVNAVQAGWAHHTPQRNPGVGTGNLPAENPQARVVPFPKAINATSREV